MKKPIAVIALLFSANVFAYDLTTVDTSSYSGDSACSNARSKAEKDADGLCRTRDPKSFLSTFRTLDYRWLKLPSGEYRCTVKSYYTCY